MPWLGDITHCKHTPSVPWGLGQFIYFQSANLKICPNPRGAEGCCLFGRNNLPSMTYQTPDFILFSTIIP
jgi:hypothetical protein